MIAIAHDIIERAQHGEDEAQVDIIKMLSPLISKFSRGIPKEWKEDAHQCGALGIMVAFKKFDYERSPDFSTFAGHYIRNEIKKLKSTCTAVCYIPIEIIEDFYKTKKEKAVPKYLKNGMRVDDIERLIQYTNKIQGEIA